MADDGTCQSLRWLSVEQGAISVALLGMYRPEAGCHLDPLRDGRGRERALSSPHAKRSGLPLAFDPFCLSVSLVFSLADLDDSWSGALAFSTFK